jgi:hypothetical protein
MIEHKEGKGKLISRQTREEYQVEFAFTFVTNIVKTPRGVVAGKADARGEVRSTAGALLPVEDYDLHADDGEIMHVRNMGLGEWVVEADI